MLNEASSTDAINLIAYLKARLFLEEDHRTDQADILICN